MLEAVAREHSKDRRTGRAPSAVMGGCREGVTLPGSRPPTQLPTASACAFTQDNGEFGDYSVHTYTLEHMLVGR